MCRVAVKSLHMASFHELFEIGDKVSSGSNNIYSGIDKATGDRIAVKIIDRQWLEQGEEDHIRYESSTIIALANQHIVKCLGMFEDDCQFYVVREWMDGGQLSERMAEKIFYPEAEAQTVVRTILNCIKCCHDNGVVHRYMTIILFQKNTTF